MPGGVVPNSGMVAAELPSARSRRKWWLLGAGGVAAVLVEVLAWIGGTDQSLGVIALALCAIGTYQQGWIAVKNFNLNINALMAIAVTGAVAIGQWLEAAMVMMLFTLAEMIEARSLDRAGNAIRSLMGMTPDKASILQADGTWQDTDAATVAAGATARVG